MSDEKKKNENAVANVFFEQELSKLHDGAFTALMAGSTLKDARLTLMRQTIEELVRMDNVSDIKTRLLIALATDNTLEGTLRLRTDADRERLNAVFKHQNVVQQLTKEEPPPPAEPPPLPTLGEIMPGLPPLPPQDVVETPLRSKKDRKL